MQDLVAQTIKIKHASVAVVGAEACPFLAALIKDQNQLEEVDKPDLILSREASGLRLSWNTANAKPLNYHLDFSKTAAQQRSFPAPKQGAFNQALGKKTRRVIDATGGWGTDAVLMYLQGYEVTIIERLPIMATILAEAFARLAESPWAERIQVNAPRVLSGNAIDVLIDASFNADCVYLDPMFPPKRKKSAATNKQMQLLQWLAGADEDARVLAQTSIQNYPRLAVKRPDYAEPLLDQPEAQFGSKLVHYDVYINPSKSGSGTV